MSYTPLQLHSAFSLLKHPNRISQIVQTAAQRGYEALALTDDETLYGAVAFVQLARQANLKPIVGLTLHLGGLVNQATPFPVVLLAQNQTGYENLLALSTAKMSLDEGELEFEALVAHREGLFVILPANSEWHTLLQIQPEQAANLADQLKKTFGKQVFVGVQPTMSPEMLSAVQQSGLAPIALATVDYLNPEDAFTTRVLQAIDLNDKLTDPTQLARQTGMNILAARSVVEQQFEAAGLQEALRNNAQVVDAVTFDLQFAEPQLPQFPTPDGQSAPAYLRELAKNGLTARLKGRQIDVAVYERRLAHELDVIEAMGFSDYFLIVADILRFAHEQHFQTGAGRGSAAGSLVAYVLRITDVDPLAFGLLFERFLNAERAQMPDIDIDLPDNHRETVLAYLHDKYGHEHVAQIITFGTLAARQALRDTARVFDVDTRTLARLSASLPAPVNGRQASLAQSFEQSKALREILADMPNGQLLFETAQKIEGLPRNYSTHAAGLVLSQTPLVQTLPLQPGSEGRLLTQYEKGAVERVGLLKIDLLGLRNLTLLDNALKLAEKQLPKDFDMSKVPLDDAQTLALFAKGDTNGIFQFESGGIKNVLRQLQPNTFELIAAVNALYRPGPMQNINAFIDRRFGRAEVTIPDPSLKTILAPTFGIIVYQEQVMLVAETYAGFSLGEADILRSAMAKKDVTKMAKLRAQFIAGAVAKGHEEAQAAKIFAYIDEFANYGFNRSHAVAYSKMAFQLAYLKAHFPVAFFAALLNANLGNQDKTRLYVAEAKARGIQVLGPDVNRSQRFFIVRDNQLQMGLHNIKGLRSDFVKALLAERENSTFKSLQELVARLPEKFRKVDTLTQLTHAGALDHFGHNRAEILASLPELIDGAHFGLLILQETQIKQREDLPLAERLSAEKNAIGVNLSAHPLDRFATVKRQAGWPDLVDVTTPDTQVMVLGFVENIRTIRTKKGEPMAFVTLSDASGSLSVTIFPNVYKRVEALIEANAVLQISGKVEMSRQLSLIANTVQIPAEPTKTPAQQGVWYLTFDEEHDNNALKNQLLQFILAHHGTAKVATRQGNQAYKFLPAQYDLADSAQLMCGLGDILGAENVIYRRETQ